MGMDFSDEEEKIINKISQSAEEIEAPKSLVPEEIVRKLSQKNNADFSTDFAEPQGENKLKKKVTGKGGEMHMKQGKIIGMRRRIVAAAAVVVVALVVGAVGIIGMSGGSGASGNAEQLAEGKDMDSEYGQIAEADGAETIVFKKNADVGSYHLASSYAEVYDALMDGISADGFTETWSTDSEAIYDETGLEDSISSGVYNSASVESEDYTTTNVQTEGVDEGDFVKTDGNYVYIMGGSSVSIVDISDEKMQTIGEISVELGDCDSLKEMYLDGDRLYLIIKRNEPLTDIEMLGDYYNESAKYADDESYREFIEENNVVASTDSVDIFTYDISDRTSPEKIAEFSQDGYYYSSRMTDGYIYIFTEYSGNIPEINGERAAYDCIYLPDDSSEGSGKMIVGSSINTDAPGSAADVMAVMEKNIAYKGYAGICGLDIYMGTDGIYFMKNDWEMLSGYTTDITKFGYEDGVMDGVGDVALKGMVEDTFAVSENGEYLRVLTTNEDEEGYVTNQLYVLGGDMDVIGTLDNIAPGESVYAARYVGDIVYFVTYENTDPLFAVDLSDPTSPTVLGELELPGYSEYLHAYSDSQLLGIGYNDEWDAVKLAMFDVTDPTELSLIDEIKIDGTYSDSMYNYKGMLVDSARGLIGFEVEDWGNGVSDDDAICYYLYSWDGEKFAQEICQHLGEEATWDVSKIRGLCSGDTFYLVNIAGNSGYRIRSYDIGDDFALADELLVEMDLGVDAYYETETTEMVDAEAENHEIEYTDVNVLSNGKWEITYYVDGAESHLTIDAPDFDPFDATDGELEEHGLPAKPSEEDTEAYSEWFQTAAQYVAGIEIVNVVNDPLMSAGE
ncbi:MAG: beta-propeller domain-containing protein [Clostridiales bacterium]|nr:beta-propeller domain-containing protein [Clostridiales bacterium]